MGRVNDLKSYGNMLGQLRLLCKSCVPDRCFDDVYDGVQELFKPFLDKKFREKK